MLPSSRMNNADLLQNVIEAALNCGKLVSFAQGAVSGKEWKKRLRESGMMPLSKVPPDFLNLASNATVLAGCFKSLPDTNNVFF